MSAIKNSVIVSLDNLKVNEIRDKLDALEFLYPDFNFTLKLNDAFVLHGSELVKELKQRRFKIFLDLKFHDIPNTVANYVCRAADLGVDMLTLHCCGGSKMMRNAAETLHNYCHEKKIKQPLLLGVTVLTSWDNETMQQDLGVHQRINERVLKFALMAQNSGLDGVICSPHEIQTVRRLCDPNFLIVTPGIRFNTNGSEASRLNTTDDQKRVTTPQRAFEWGANYIVVGRPMLQSLDQNKILSFL